MASSVISKLTNLSGLVNHTSAQVDVKPSLTGIYKCAALSSVVKNGILEKCCKKKKSKGKKKIKSSAYL